jgi:hypothetical protein
MEWAASVDVGASGSGDDGTRPLSRGSIAMVAGFGRPPRSASAITAASDGVSGAVIPTGQSDPGSSPSCETSSPASPPKPLLSSPAKS